MSEVSGSNPDLKPVIKFHYIKSNFFRVVHADGIWGGVTPSGYIQMAVFNQRTPIPQQIANILEDGRIGQEVPGLKITKDGVVREVEVDLIMDLSLAINMREWLDEKIKQLEKNPKA